MCPAVNGRFNFSILNHKNIVFLCIPTEKFTHNVHIHKAFMINYFKGPFWSKHNILLLWL